MGGKKRKPAGVEHPKEDDVRYVYTDGAAQGNQFKDKTKRFGGVGVYFGDGDPDNVSRFLDGTNNDAEYEAVRTALEIIRTRKDPEGKHKWEVRTDSNLVVNTLMGAKPFLTGWIDRGGKKVDGTDAKFLDISMEIEALRRSHPGGVIPLRHVRREFNSKADALATAGANKGREGEVEVDLESTGISLVVVNATGKTWSELDSTPAGRRAVFQAIRHTPILDGGVDRALCTKNGVAKTVARVAFVLGIECRQVERLVDATHILVLLSPETAKTEKAEVGWRNIKTMFKPGRHFRNIVRV